MSMTMPRGSILQIYATDLVANGGDGTAKYNKITEHNRSEFTYNPIRIESSRRMSNGTMRKFWIADKQSFTLSWSMLPSYRTLTVDGQWGAEDLKSFYEANEGAPFNIRVNKASAGSSQESSGYEEYTVVFSSPPSFVIVKRGLQPHWNVSISLEEV